MFGSKAQKASSARVDAALAHQAAAKAAEAAAKAENERRANPKVHKGDKNARRR